MEQINISLFQAVDNSEYNSSSKDLTDLRKSDPSWNDYAIVACVAVSVLQHCLEIMRF